MEINASLRRIHLHSPQPGVLANFYQKTYGLHSQKFGPNWICRAAGREFGVSEGQAGQLKYALFGFKKASDWKAFLKRTESLTRADLSDIPQLPEGSVGFTDPEGNMTVFCLPPHVDAPHERDALSMPAALQHFAMRTQSIELMVKFYSEQLGYVVSDRVLDEKGNLKACFLRTDKMHHAMALFSASVRGFDHQSYETPDWSHMKNWADHMGQHRNTIVWGIGRHGPGDDVFFMVRDPDENLAEISSEIEVCKGDRPVGIWRHEERTLNLWGKAIMRT